MSLQTPLLVELLRTPACKASFKVCVVSYCLHVDIKLKTKNKLNETGLRHVIEELLRLESTKTKTKQMRFGKTSTLSSSLNKFPWGLFKTRNFSAKNLLKCWGSKQLFLSHDIATENPHTACGYKRLLLSYFLHDPSYSIMYRIRIGFLHFHSIK